MEKLRLGEMPGYEEPYFGRQVRGVRHWLVQFRERPLLIRAGKICCHHHCQSTLAQPMIGVGCVSDRTCKLEGKTLHPAAALQLRAQEK